MRSGLFVFGWLLMYAATAQQARDVSAADYLRLRFPSERFGELRPVGHRTGLTGTRLLYQQHHRGVPVVDGFVKLHRDPAGTLTLLSGGAHDLSDCRVWGDFPPLSNRAPADYEFYREEKAYLIQGDSLLPTRYVRYARRADGLEDAEMWIDATGRVVARRDLLLRKRTGAPVDSLVPAYVFNPDPLTCAERAYGPPYVDAADADLGLLNAERAAVELRVTWEDDTFRLRNSTCHVGEFDTPVRPVCALDTPDFRFGRAHPFFEQVNVFYHLNALQAHLQRLGFDSLANRSPVRADANGCQGGDYSFYSPTMHLLAFGEGGVDDAEDADVIIHEYTHALSHSAAPGTNVGLERRSIEEGNGDYFAASYSRALSSYDWENIYNWDGHNEFWSGRTVQNEKRYPQDRVGNIYADGEIWSSALMLIWGDLGRDTTDRLLLESIFDYHARMRMPEAARLLLRADTLLYDAAHADRITERFKEKGILRDPVTSVADELRTAFRFENTGGFARGETMRVRWAPLRSNSVSFRLVGSNGRPLGTWSRVEGTAWALSGASLQSGVYYLQVMTPRGTFARRIVRF
ncbi:MAG: hypothetical protein WBA12_01080 [Catalinimonas sp.]